MADAQAIQQAGVKRVVHLSSYGAHLEKGTGFIVGSYQVEKRLNTLPNQELEANGVPAGAAAALVELGLATHSGILREDYDHYKPVLGTVKPDHFTLEFAAGFARQQTH